MNSLIHTNLNESYLSEVYQHVSSENQTNLSNFGASNEDELGTLIAVVQDPTGGIVDVCDEFYRELGMPQNYLNQLREKRNKLPDSLTDTETHNTAVKQVQLEAKYREYVQNSDAAKKRITQISNRIQNGETITLVCFEKPPKWCHRYVLQDVIKTKIEQS